VGGWVGRGDAPHFVLKPPRAGQAPKTTDFRPLTNYISFLGSHRSRGKHFRLLNRAEGAQSALTQSTALVKPGPERGGGGVSKVKPYPPRRGLGPVRGRIEG
jgi:hypothetical protein